MDAGGSARELRDYRRGERARTRPSRLSARIGRGSGDDRLAAFRRRRIGAEAGKCRVLLRARQKGWVSDPSGISWETFHTFGESTVYGNDVAPRPAASKPGAAEESCCAPAPSSAAACCSGAKAQ